MVALVAGFGFAWDYTGESVLAISSGNWGLIGLIAFGVFILLTVVREIDLALQQRPKIRLKHEVYNNRALLEVKNLGGNASFTARAKVIDKVLQPESYYMCWDSITGVECPINKDGEASILVGRLSYESKGYGDKLEREVVLFRISESGTENFYLSSPQVNEQLELSKRYPTMPTQIPEEKCTIEVSITSKPSPIKAFKPQRYLFKIDHDNEDSLIFTSESNPDKEDYQA